MPSLAKQVSVAAATRLSVRLAGALDTATPPAIRRPGLDRAFPTPRALVEADVALALNMPRARGAAVRALATTAIAQPHLLSPGQGLEAADARLTGLPGVGNWTAHYIAIRALGEPDALPSGDIGLLRAFLDRGTGRPTPAELLARAQAWQPCRAYAAMHFWAGEPARSTTGP